MDSDNAKPTSLSLDPIEPAGGHGPAAAAPGTDGARPPLPRIETTDRHLAQAADEYEKGIVDEPLWRNAVAQTKNDEALVVAAYLRARATALQIQERARRAESRAQSQGQSHAASAARAAASAIPERARPSRAGKPSTRMIVAVAGAVGVAIAAVAAVVGMSDEGAGVETTAVPSVRKQSVASAARAAEAPGKQAQGGAAARAAAAQGTAAADAAAREAAAQAAAQREALVRKVASLEQAGNWNVQVLYAAEWTRQEPTNADAWSRLSAGYLRLDQFDEAYEAAQHAVQVAPENADHWASLGTLYIRLERQGEARDALERALSLDAQHERALCAALALAAAEGRRDDMAAHRQQLGTREAGCPRNDAAVPRIEKVDASGATRTARPKGR